MDSSSSTVPPGRTYGGESAETRSAQRRRRLLDAGLETFGSIGYRKATVRGLCREAHVADRYFYEEFESTEDLLLAVYDDCMDRLGRAVLEAVADLGDDVAGLARAGLDAFLSAVEADRRVARVVWFEVLGVSARVEARHIRGASDFGALLVELLDARGILRSRPPQDRRVVLTAVVGGISQVVVDWTVEDFATPRAVLVRPLTDFLVAGAALEIDTRS